MIIVIIGPTGVGKTKLSIELAKKYNADIINGDSMQVYKELNIGTAKVKEEEKENITHHLFDICEVEELYTVYDYQRDCRNIIDKLQQQNKNIIIVGGTGLYIKAALYDYQFKKQPELNDYNDLTDEEIFNKIKEYASDIDTHINNRKRNTRLLNKYENDLMTTKNSNHSLYNATFIGLTTNRENLYTKINNRVDTMISEGLLEEVQSLYKRKINSKSIQTGIGYKELYKYFDGECTKQEAIDNIKKNSRHYAKRQYTFFNNQLPVNWFETDYDNFNKTVEEVTKFIETKKL